MADTIEKINDGTGYVAGRYNKIETWDSENITEMASLYKRILELLGENPDREGLIETPLRVSKAMYFLTNGYYTDAEEILKSAMFKEEYKQMVIVKDIDIYSMCEHHLLPFFG
jgi:GTP cyclohydrolase I